MAVETATGIYRYNTTFFTGTVDQPDTISIYVKKDQGEGSFHINHNRTVANWVGYTPFVGCFSGVVRIVNAVKTIFAQFTGATSPAQTDYWNAIKNIFRGIAEFVPFAGGITLIIYDSVRDTLYTDAIMKEMHAEENIAGIAMDGKIIHNMSLNKLKEMLPNTDFSSNQRYLAVFRHLCLELLGRQDGQQLTIPESFSHLN